MESFSLDLNVLQSIGIAASTKETCYYLCGVYVEVSARAVRYVATDGHILAATETALPEGADDHTLVGAWIISSDAIKGIKIPKRADPTATVTRDGERGLRLDHAAGVAVIQPINGTFPSDSRVVPRTVNGELAQFDGRLLARLQQVALGVLLCDKDSTVMVPTIFHNGQGPALAKWDVPGAPELLGVIMPIRRTAELGLPAWFA